LTSVTRNVQVYLLTTPIHNGWPVVWEELRRENHVTLSVWLRVSDADLILFDVENNHALGCLDPLLVTRNLLVDVPNQVLHGPIVLSDIVIECSPLRLLV
jgi:hypothetical protein